MDTLVKAHHDRLGEVTIEFDRPVEHLEDGDLPVLRVRGERGLEGYFVGLTEEEARQADELFSWLARNRTSGCALRIAQEIASIAMLPFDWETIERLPQRFSAAGRHSF